jgi:hypothetical protein
MPACLPRSTDFRVLLRVFDRGRRKIFAVEFDQVEGAEDYIRGVLLAHQVKPLVVEKDLGLDGA